MQQCEELWKYELYVHKLLNTLETAKSFRVKATAIEGETKKKKTEDQIQDLMSQNLAFNT
jgi:hypothetical protein